MGEAWSTNNKLKEVWSAEHKLKEMWDGNTKFWSAAGSKLIFATDTLYLKGADNTYTKSSITNSICSINTDELFSSTADVTVLGSSSTLVGMNYEVLFAEKNNDSCPTFVIFKTSADYIKIYKLVGQSLEAVTGIPAGKKCYRIAGAYATPTMLYIVGDTTESGYTAFILSYEYSTGDFTYKTQTMGSDTPVVDINTFGTETLYFFSEDKYDMYGYNPSVSPTIKRKLFSGFGSVFDGGTTKLGDIVYTAGGGCKLRKMTNFAVFKSNPNASNTMTTLNTDSYPFVSTAIYKEFVGVHAYKGQLLLMNKHRIENTGTVLYYGFARSATPDTGGWISIANKIKGLQANFYGSEDLLFVIPNVAPATVAKTYQTENGASWTTGFGRVKNVLSAVLDMNS